MFLGGYHGIPIHQQYTSCCRCCCWPDYDVYHAHAVTGVSPSWMQDEVYLIPSLNVPHPLHPSPVADAFRLRLLIIPTDTLRLIDRGHAQTNSPEGYALRGSIL